MPISEHEDWRFDLRSGSILGPNNQVVAVIEDRDKAKIGPVLVRAFRLLEDLENYMHAERGDGLDRDTLIPIVAECRGETAAETSKRLGWGPPWK
jgi:hypothetical protein